MKKSSLAFGAARHYLRRWFNRLATSGDWALSLSADARRNLRWFFSDSLFASASDNIVITYLSLYVLALGATGAQIGAWSALSGLTAAAMLLPGALLVERIGHRKNLTVLFGGGMARLVLLLLAFLPLILGGPALVYLAIGFSVMRDAFGNLAYPAWMSLVGDIVPFEGRGRYFGSRNFVMGVAGMSTVLVFGELITRLGQPVGYQVALGAAFAIGMISTYSFSRIRDPHTQPAPRREPPTKVRVPVFMLLRGMFRLPGFMALSLTAILWNFSLNIAGPFFNVYMIRVLHITPTLVAVNSVVSTIASMVAQLFLGRLADRWGPRRLQMISGLLIPVLPFAWVFVRVGWHILPINIVGGALWGVYNLASFNLLLAMIPEAQRARYSALFQIVVTVALAIGSAAGGVIVTQWGYHAIFIGSAAGRMLAALLFAFFVRLPAPASR